MQTIGLVGGMGWESSAEYYRLLNLGVQERLGGLSSAKVVLNSVEFAELTRLQNAEDWHEVAAILRQAAKSVEAAGADVLLMCTTAFHRVAEQVEAAIDIPLLHLGDVIAEACTTAGLDTVAFLGTEFAMGRSFFLDRLAGHGLNVLTPSPELYAEINTVIYDELVHGRIVDSSRKRLVEITSTLWDQGAQGLILGCTELEALIHQSDVDLPVFAGTALHVRAALDRAL